MYSTNFIATYSGLEKSRLFDTGDRAYGYNIEIISL